MTHRTPVNVGVVGYGQGGATLHCPLIESTPGLRLAGIAVSSEGGVERARAVYPGLPITTSVTDLLSVRDLDLVVITSPNQTHAPIAGQALDAGFDVVVDKPLATSSREAHELERHANAAGRHLLTFVNRRWDGDFQAMKDLTDANVLGAPVRLESRWERYRPIAPSGTWKDDPAAGGGLLWNLLPHLVDQALHLLGPAAWVWCEMGARRSGARADDDTWVVIGHADGPISFLVGSYLSTVAGPRLRLVGSRATFVAGEVDPSPTAGHATARLCEPDDTGAQLRAAARVIDEAGSRAITVPADDHGAFYRALARALAGEGPLPVNAAEGVAVVDVLDAAGRSASSGNRVYLTRRT